MEFEEIEARLNLPYYVPPSQRGDAHDIGQRCPYCGTTNTYFSGLFMCWQCNKCDGLFSLQDVWDKEE